MQCNLVYITINALKHLAPIIIHIGNRGAVGFDILQRYVVNKVKGWNVGIEGFFINGFVLALKRGKKKRKSPNKISNGFGYFCCTKVPKKLTEFMRRLYLTSF